MLNFVDMKDWRVGFMEGSQKIVHFILVFKMVKATEALVESEHIYKRLNCENRACMKKWYFKASES